MVVEISDVGVRVVRGQDIRMQVSWADVARLVVDDEHTVCMVDGGSPERRLIVPGPGLSAPYRIEESRRLVAELVRRIPAERHVALDAVRPPPDITTDRPRRSGDRSDGR
jgi:hypothetical protein